MKVFYSTKNGIGKIESEDLILINENIYSETTGNIEIGRIERIAIADGVGGNKGGRDAAKYLLKSVLNLKISTGNDLSKIFREINKLLLKYSNEISEKRKMATTFTGLINCGDNMYVVHVGNTRLYIKQGSYLKQITHDHTTVQYFLDMGNEIAAELCNKSEIRACFGGGDESYIELLHIRRIFEDGLPRRIIFSTDGIHDYVNICEMEMLLARTENIEDGIIKLNDIAIKNGSRDDRTLIVIENI